MCLYPGVEGFCGAYQSFCIEYMLYCARAVAVDSVPVNPADVVESDSVRRRSKQSPDPVPAAPDHPYRGGWHSGIHSSAVVVS